MRRPKQRLQDILDAIEKIERYVLQGKERFVEDELVQNWFVTQILIIGEAAKHLPESVYHENPDVEWNKIIGMRNILVHGYFTIDLDTVWGVVTDYMPELKKNILRILDE
ncbi:MAG: DUF86 domain-containing protein [Candidatus Hinthialibacter antarcticus]|nr:DUF86 domain-containing protein [Candidatus Hinthialibacter antarcticus]